MSPRRHFLVGLFVASVSLLFNQSFPFIRIEVFGVELTVFALCIAANVLLDFDHFLDFKLNRNLRRMNLEQLFREGKMYVVFHSVENAIILALLSVFSSVPNFSNN